MIGGFCTECIEDPVVGIRLGRSECWESSVNIDRT